MANVYIGTTIVFGCSGSTAATMTGTTDLALLQDMDLTHTADKDAMKDGSGNTKSVVFSDHRDSFSINFFPDGAAAGATALPLAGATLTWYDAADSQLNTKNFMIDGWNRTRSNTKAMAVKIDLSRFINNTVP